MTLNNETDFTEFRKKSSQYTNPNLAKMLKKNCINQN